MAVGSVPSRGPSNLLHLDSLTKLGISAPDAKKIREEILKKAPESVDQFNYVPASELSKYGLKLQLPPALLERIDRATSRSTTAPIVATLDPAGYPSPTLRQSEARVFAAGAGQPTEAQLAPYQASLSSLISTLRSEGKIMGEADLLDVVRRFGPRLTSHPTIDGGLSLAQVDQLSALLAGGKLPAHTERDAVMDLSSKHRLLAEKNGIKFFHQQGYEGFTIERAAPNKAGEATFSVHATKKDKVLVSVPEGCSLLIVDKDGSERGALLKAQKRTILGKEERVVEIDRSMIYPSGTTLGGSPKLPPFSLRVLDSAGKTVADQNIAFAPQPLPFSNEVLRGSLGYQSAPADEVSRWAMDHAAPKGSENKTPVGRRPQFRLNDGAISGDRLLITKDEGSFAVTDFLQLLSPPRHTPQSFARNGATYTLKSEQLPDLDDKNDARLSGSIKSSAGEVVSLDRNAKKPLQATWGLGGISVFGKDGALKAQFDPLDPTQEINHKRKS